MKILLCACQGPPSSAKFCKEAGPGDRLWVWRRLWRHWKSWEMIFLKTYWILPIRLDCSQNHFEKHCAEAGTHHKHLTTSWPALGCERSCRCQLKQNPNFHLSEGGKMLWPTLPSKNPRWCAEWGWKWNWRRAAETSMVFLGALFSRMEENWFLQSIGCWLKVWFLRPFPAAARASCPPPLSALEPTCLHSVRAGAWVSQAWDAVQKLTPVRSGFPAASAIKFPQVSWLHRAASGALQVTSRAPLFSYKLLPFPTLQAGKSLFIPSFVPALISAHLDSKFEYQLPKTVLKIFKDVDQESHPFSPPTEQLGCDLVPVLTVRATFALFGSSNNCSPLLELVPRHTVFKKSGNSPWHLLSDVLNICLFFPQETLYLVYIPKSIVFYFFSSLRFPL